jgi:hypothetical protein
MGRHNLPGAAAISVALFMGGCNGSDIGPESPVPNEMPAEYSRTPLDLDSNPYEPADNQQSARPQDANRGNWLTEGAAGNQPKEQAESLGQPAPLSGDPPLAAPNSVEDGTLDPE